jgi:hypothetical protein
LITVLLHCETIAGLPSSKLRWRCLAALHPCLSDRRLSVFLCRFLLLPLSSVQSLSSCA